MLNNALLWIRQRKKRLFGILLLLFIFFLFFPFSISDNELTRTEWCAGFHNWRFAEDGSFEQSFLLIGDFDGVRYSDQGVWSNSGRSVHVDIEKGDFKGGGADFIARSLGFGKLLWSYGSFSLDKDDEGFILMFSCEVN
ncbi:MAG: hypothetical protein DHS20C20_10400 [Ardenticatenaceae bacterium]|nr:MAG: hypothetical protein DHS20C20_10400 [Ardenticatenaceae bacterium]